MSLFNNSRYTDDEIESYGDRANKIMKRHALPIRTLVTKCINNANTLGSKGFMASTMKFPKWTRDLITDDNGVWFTYDFCWVDVWKVYPNARQVYDTTEWNGNDYPPEMELVWKTIRASVNDYIKTNKINGKIIYDGDWDDGPYSIGIAAADIKKMNESVACSIAELRWMMHEKY